MHLEAIEQAATGISNRARNGSGERVKRIARLVVVGATSAIAVAYASAFMPTGAPVWASWLLAIGIPSVLGGVMVLGAAHKREGLGRLAAPFVVATLILAVGFCVALALPANESPASALWLGLPLRAAVVIYGVGLIPTIVLPVAYALTFESQTLNAEDLDRIRELNRHQFDRLPSGTTAREADLTRFR